MSPSKRSGRGHPGGQSDHDKKLATRLMTVDSATQESRCHRRKIFIGGLSHYVTTQQLSEYFSRFGAIADAVVLRWPDGRSRGFGYVTFVDASAALAALATKHSIGNRQVDVKRAVPGTNKLFVGGLHQNTTASELCEHFEQFGSVSDAVVLMDPSTGRSRGFGFVCFVPGSEGSEAVKAAFQQYDKHRIRGKWIEVKCAVPPDRPSDDEDSALSTGESHASTPERVVTPLGTPTQGSPRWGQSTPPRDATKVVRPPISALRRPPAARAAPASDEPKKVPLPSPSLNLIAAIGLPPGLEAPVPAAVAGWPGCEPLTRRTPIQAPGSPPLLAITLKEMLMKNTFALECDDFAVAWGPGPVQRTSGDGCVAGARWDWGVA